MCSACCTSNEVGRFATPRPSSDAQSCPPILQLRARWLVQQRERPEFRPRTCHCLDVCGGKAESDTRPGNDAQLLEVAQGQERGEKSRRGRAAGPGRLNTGAVTCALCEYHDQSRIRVRRWSVTYWVALNLRLRR